MWTYKSPRKDLTLAEMAFNFPAQRKKLNEKKIGKETETGPA
jgi:hypothetical protein